MHQGNSYSPGFELCLKHAIGPAIDGETLVVFVSGCLDAVEKRQDELEKVIRTYNQGLDDDLDVLWAAVWAYAGPQA